MYKTILVPHGGTDTGDAALKHAIHISKLESSKIIILYVIHTWHDHSFGAIRKDEKYVKMQIEKIFSHVEKNVKEFLAERVEICKKEGIDCKGIFRTGNPSETIIKYSNDEQIDLIIMGKKRKIPNYKSFLKIGSVAKQVQENVHCPIMLVGVED